MSDDTPLDAALRRYLAKQGRKGGQATAARRSGNRFTPETAAAAVRKRWARAQRRNEH
jgi:hypothetical protein